jgi:hypothetical protein
MGRLNLPNQSVVVKGILTPPHRDGKACFLLFFGLALDETTDNSGFLSLFLQVLNVPIKNDQSASAFYFLSWW